MSFPRYPEYKDSGVEWLGEVPGHWHIDRFKRSISSCQNGIWGSEPAGDENDLPCVRVADFDRVKLVVNDEIPTIRNVTPREQENRVLRRGNLVLEKSGGGDKQLVGCVVLYDADTAVVCSNFVARIELERSMVPSYWRYAHAAAYAVRLNYGSIKQTSGIQNLDQDAYFDERSAFPPPDEQAAIAAFLDRETAKIDALVAEQQNLIALLKEKRQALISHAVTKGLDPDVPMQDSGSVLLGKTPAHWEIGPLKRFAEVIDCKHHTVEFLDEGLPIVSIRELHDDRIDLGDAKRTSQAEWDFLREGRVPQAGDLIFCRNASVGAVGYVEAGQEFCMGQDVCLIRPETTNRFTHFQLSSSIVREQIEAFLVGATIRRANVAEIRGLVMTWPPAEEQARISDYLIDETGQFDELMQEAETTIALLQERRTALISAAVTGKIDVRHLAVASTEPTP